MDFNDILKGVQKAGEDIDKQLKQIGKDIDNQKRKIFNEPIQDENIEENEIINKTEETISKENKEESNNDGVIMGSTWRCDILCLCGYFEHG